MPIALVTAGVTFLTDYSFLFAIEFALVLNASLVDVVLISCVIVQVICRVFGCMVASQFRWCLELW